MAHVLTQLKIVPKQDCTEATNLARELGLELQAKRYEKPLAEHAFKELSADEAVLWAHHCRTTYIPGGDDQNSRRRPIEQYAFDTIPIEVMRHWKAIKDNYAFDRFEIWTTERSFNKEDPLLIGVIGAKLYLLARWGLESPEQLPLKEIAQKIYDDEKRDAERYDRGFDYPFRSAANSLKRRMAWKIEQSSYLGAAARLLGLAT